MAVAVDVAGSEQGFTTAATTQTYNGLSIGTGLSNAAVTFMVTAGQAAGGLAGATFTATYNGVACTQVIRHDMGNGVASMAIFGLVLGNSPASGTHNFIITTTNQCVAVIQGTSWTGVDQTGGTTSFPHSGFKDQNPTSVTSDTLVITTANGNATYAQTTMGGTATYSFSPGSLYTADSTTLVNSGATSMGGESLSTTTSTTYTASQGSLDFIVIVGTDILAAAGAAVSEALGNTIFKPLLRRYY